MFKEKKKYVLLVTHDDGKEVVLDFTSRDALRQWINSVCYYVQGKTIRAGSNQSIPVMLMHLVAETDYKDAITIPESVSKKMKNKIRISLGEMGEVVKGEVNGFGI